MKSLGSLVPPPPVWAQFLQPEFDFCVHDSHATIQHFPTWEISVSVCVEW